MEIIITEDYEEMSKLAARLIAKQLLRKPNSVLGLDTGVTLSLGVRSKKEAGAGSDR